MPKQSHSRCNAVKTLAAVVLRRTAVAFLAVDELSFNTSDNLVVDGGYPNLLPAARRTILGTIFIYEPSGMKSWQL